jgi:hypothetical protein
LVELVSSAERLLRSTTEVSGQAAGGYDSTDGDCRYGINFLWERIFGKLNNPTKIELEGTACRAIKTSDHDVRVTFPCGVITTIPK